MHFFKSRHRRAVGPRPRIGLTLRKIACAAFLFACAEGRAATLIWTGAAGDGDIGMAGNWSPSQAPAAGDLLTFSGSTGTAPQLATALSVGSISFSNTAAAFTLGGAGAYTIAAGGVTNSSAGNQAINNALALSAAQTWSATSGSLLIGGNVGNGGFLLTIGGGFATTIGGNITGTGGLTKSGTGTLTLNGGNTFSGAAILSAGTVALGNNSAFGTGTVTLGGAQIQTAGGSRIIANAISLTATAVFTNADELTLAGTISMNSNRIVTLNGAGALTLGGVVSQVSGNRSLTKNGAGTLVLNGANTFSGGLVVSAGTIILGNNAAAGTGPLSLGTVSVQAAGTARTLTNAVSLTGNPTYPGAYDFTFTGAALLTGSRTLTINSSVVTFSGAFGQSSTTARTLTKAGAGTLVLGGAAANTYTGSTIVNDGALILSKTAGVNAFGGAVLTVGDAVGAAGSASVQLNAASQIPDTNAVTVKADGLLNLQTFTEAIGTLTLTGGSILGTGGARLDLGGAVTVTTTGSNVAVISAGLGLNANRTFTINNNAVATDVDLSVSGAITDGSAASALTKAGLGTLLLSGANGFSGGANLLNGRLLLDSATALGTGAVNLGDTAGANAAALVFSGTSGRTLANAITVRAGNTGVQTLGGVNTGGVNTFSGGITLAKTATLTADAGGEVLFSGAISGAGFGITKIGAGTVRLGAANPFTGLTTISAGTLAYGGSNALASGAVTISGATAVLDLGANQTDTVGQIILDAGAQITGSGTSALTSTAAFDLRNGAVNIPLSGSVGLTKSTAGTVILSGVNTYTGATSITAGTLRLGVATSVPTNSAVSISAGAALDLQGFAQTIGSLAGAGGVTLGAATLMAGGDNSSTTFSGAVSGAGGVTKWGGGTLTFSGANTFTGATTIGTGTLRLGAANGLHAASAVSVAAGATFDLNSFSTAIGSLSGAGGVTLGTGRITAGGDHSTTAFSGVIGGTGGLTKNGGGTMTLNGTNPFSGSVTVNAGALTFAGSSGRAAFASGFTVGSSAALTLDNSAGEHADRIGGAAAITLGDGTLRFISDGNGTLETVGALNASGGASNIAIVHNGAAGDSTALTFASLGIIASGATVNFTATGGTLGAGANGPHIYITGKAGGLMGGWATVGSDFAEYSAFGVRAFAGYYLGSDGINVNDDTKIVLLNSTSPSSAFTLTNAGTTTDLGLSVNDLATVDLGAAPSRTLNLAGGGLIKSGAPATTISGAGRLTAGGTGSGTLAIAVDAGHTLTISASIIDNAGVNGTEGDGDDGVVALSKADAGLLVLSGANTFGGNTFINAGTLQIGAENHLGAAANDVIFGGGTLSVTAGFLAGTGKTFTVAADLTGTLDLAPGQTLTLGDASDLLTTGNTASVLHQAGAGDLALPAANPGFDGTLQIDAGGVELRHAQALGDATNRGRLALNGGTLKLRNNVDTGFANDVTLAADATIDVARLGGATPAITHTLGGLSIGARTLTITGSNGAALTFGAVTLTGGAVFNPTTADATLGAVSGAFAFTKSGAGALVLNGAGTYTGATAVGAGTLRIGIAAGVPSTSAVSVASGAVFDVNHLSVTIGSLTGTGGVTLGSGTLTVGGDHSSTIFSGVIGGSGGVAKSGAGTFTLSGANAFTGATTISAGRLQLGIATGVPASSALTVAGGAIFDLADFNASIGSLAGAGSVTLGSGTLTAGADHSSTTFSGIIGGSGGFTKSGAGVLSLGGANTFSGALNVGGGVIFLQNSAAAGDTAGGTFVAAGAELRIGTGVSVGAEVLWLGGAGASGAGALRLLSGAASWAGNITLSTAAGLGADAGLLTLGGSINLGANALTFTGAGATQSDGAIGGSGGLVKDGAGVLTLTAANNFSGPVTINAGAVNLQNDAALGATGPASATTVASGAALQLNNAGGIGVGDETLTLSGDGIGGAGALDSILGVNAWAGGITLAADSTIAVEADTLTLSGVVGESGGARALTKTGAGILVLGGANSFSGATRINAGTLQIGSSHRLGDSSAVMVAAGATLDLNDSAEIIGSLAGAGAVSFGTLLTAVLTTGGDHRSTTFSGLLSGAGDFTKTGAGTLTLSGANSFTGAVSILGGALSINADARLGDSANALTISGGILQAGGAFTSARAIAIGAGGATIDTNGNTVILSGAISGSNALLKTGAGALRITGANPSFTGPTTIGAGSLILSGATGPGAFTIQNDAALGGTGTVGSVTVESGGTLAPGEAITGLLNMGNFTLQSGAHLSIELGGATAGAPANGYDQAGVAGGITLAGDLQGSLLGGFQPAHGDLFFLLVNDGADAVSGTFAGLAQGSTVTFGGRDFAVSYVGDSIGNAFTGGNDVALKAIPEPRAWSTICVGMLAFLGKSRRPRRIFVHPACIAEAIQKAL